MPEDKKDEKKQPESDSEEKKRGGTGDAPGASDKEQNGGEKPEKSFTQADVDRIVTERLERERQKQEKAATDAQKKAEEEALAKRQEFEELAKQRAERVAELEPQLEQTTAENETLQSRVQALEEAIAADVESEIAGLNLSPSITELLQGKDVLDRRTWLTAHRDELKKSRGQGAPPSPGPDRRGAGGGETEKKATRQHYARSF